MGKLLVLNQTNIVADGTNSRFIYTFPNGGFVFKDDLIALQSVSQYYSAFNITSAYGNNKYRYFWVNSTFFDVVIPDGYYTLNDINAHLQSVMFANKHYLINNATGANVYFINWSINQSKYVYQLSVFPTIVSSYPIGTTGNTFKYPPNYGNTWIMNNLAPCVIIQAKFNEIVGFKVGDYPLLLQGSAQSFLSTTSPQIVPSPTILMYCSLVNNRAVIPNNLIFAYTPSGVEFGAIQTYEPTAELAWCKINDGNYNQFLIEFRDQFGRELQFEDPNTTIILHTKNKNEWGEKNI
jgi:hypothetical protein